MRILIISRSTLFTQRGGDTVQVEQTARFLAAMGAKVHIQTTGFCDDFKEFDVMHFFNLNRPADILPYLVKGRPPLVTTSIYIDYSKVPHTSVSQKVLHRVSNHFGQEYVKTLARAVNGTDRMPKKAYITKGYKKMVKLVLDKSARLITASTFEQQLISHYFGNTPQNEILALGTEHFSATADAKAERKGVLCVARFEALKNQLNLIRAQRIGGWPLTLVGDASENQKKYLQQCKQEAGDEVKFLPFTSGEPLQKLYAEAKVHALPSHYETTGLANLEAMLSGCQVVCGAGGAQKEIFGEVAFVADTNSPASINDVVNKALAGDTNNTQWVQENFSWEETAKQLMEIYKSVRV